MVNYMLIIAVPLFSGVHSASWEIKCLNQRLFIENLNPYWKVTCIMRSGIMKALEIHRAVLPFNVTVLNTFRTATSNPSACVLHLHYASGIPLTMVQEDAKTINKCTRRYAFTWKRIEVGTLWSHVAQRSFRTILWQSGENVAGFWVSLFWEKDVSFNAPEKRASGELRWVITRKSVNVSFPILNNSFQVL